MCSMWVLVTRHMQIENSTESDLDQQVLQTVHKGLYNGINRWTVIPASSHYDVISVVTSS